MWNVGPVLIYFLVGGVEGGRKRQGMSRPHGGAICI